MSLGLQQISQSAVPSFAKTLLNQEKDDSCFLSVSLQTISAYISQQLTHCFSLGNKIYLLLFNSYFCYLLCIRLSIQFQVLKHSPPPYHHHHHHHDFTKATNIFQHLLWPGCCLREEKVLSPIIFILQFEDVIFCFGKLKHRYIIPGLKKLPNSWSLGTHGQSQSKADESYKRLS